MIQITQRGSYRRRRKRGQGQGLVVPGGLLLSGICASRVRDEVYKRRTEKRERGLEGFGLDVHDWDIQWDLLLHERCMEAGVA